MFSGSNGAEQNIAFLHNERVLNTGQIDHPFTVEHQTWNRSPEEWFLSISTHNDFGLVVENTPLLLSSYNKYNIIKLLIIGNSQNISCNYYKILFEAVIFTGVISHCS